MATDSKSQSLHMRWDVEDLETAELVARLRNEAEYTKLTAHDVIKQATRKYCAEYLQAAEAGR